LPGGSEMGIEGVGDMVFMRWIVDDGEVWAGVVSKQLR
jgi:hypothetical protein